LKAHLAELNSGSPERILDIAVILRTLMCGTTKNGGRLLFRFAAEISAIPVCYTFSGLELNAPDLPLNDEQTIYLLSGAVGIPTSNLRIETDLDRWLEQIALIAPHKCLKKAYPFGSGGSIYCVVQDTVRSWNSCSAHVERAIWLGM
jgi:hypothetical protein